MANTSPVRTSTNTAVPDSALFSVTAFLISRYTIDCNFSSILKVTSCASYFFSSAICSTTLPRLSLRTTRAPSLPTNIELKLASTPSIPLPSMLVKPINWAASSTRG